MTNSSQTFFQQSGMFVGMPAEINQSVKKDIFRYIDKNHYRGIPKQENGDVNPYQYCYGLGLIIDDFQPFGAFISGYPTQAFQHYAPHIVEKLGNPWVSKNVANSYRIVAHYPDHADKLLREYESIAITRGLKILYSLPTKGEKDAVCNFGWFERNGFNHYNTTKENNARFYVKQIADTPTVAGTHNFSKVVSHE